MASPDAATSRRRRERHTLGTTYVPSTLDCEYAATAGKGRKEKVVFTASSGTNPYNVFIGVAGGAGVTGGNVTVNVTMQSAVVAHSPRTSWAERAAT